MTGRAKNIPPHKGPSRETGTLRERLKKVRQVDAAAILDVSRSYTSQILSGERLASIETIVDAANKLRLTNDELGESLREFVILYRAQRAA